MICVHCSGTHIVFNGRYKDGKQRYKCCDCKKQFCETTGSFFFKHRTPLQILAVALFPPPPPPRPPSPFFFFFFFFCCGRREYFFLVVKERGGASWGGGHEE